MNWDKLTTEEKIEELWEKQKAIRAVVNAHSETFYKINERIKSMAASIDFCKAAIAGIKFKLENKTSKENIFDSLFGR